MIRVIITWWTIDDLEYSREIDEPKDHNSLVPELLEQSNLQVTVQATLLMQKDSRFMWEKEQEEIYAECLHCNEELIIITHWTLTMPDTARYLWAKSIDKTIVLLWAMIPANKGWSDALFNLWTAVAAVQLLDKWVYVAMNWKIFDWNNVRKNNDLWVFQLDH